MFLLIVMSYCSIGFSQKSPVKWSFSQEKIGDTEYVLIFTANLEDNWNTYSQFTEDNGPIPTAITYLKKAGVTLVGKGIETGDKKEGLDPLFDANVIKFTYKKPYVIRQKIKVNDATKSLSGYLTFMTCNDETCLPPTDVDFSFTFEKKNEVTNKDDQSSKDKSSNSDVTTKANFPVVISSITGGDSNTSNTNAPVKWTFSHKKLNETTVRLTYKGNIDEGWTVYSQYTSDDGPTPTSITYDKTTLPVLVGKSVESGKKKEGRDPIFKVNVIKFLDGEPFVITQDITVTSETNSVKGYLTYMACDDASCLPPTDVDFEFFLNGTTPLADISSAIGPNIVNGKIDQRIPSLFNTYQNPKAACGTEIQQSTGYFWTFLFGFMGGLLALLTPCVFPMIPITVSFFTKDNKRKGWVNGLIYGLSIIGIYVILGLAVTAFFGPEALNRLSTNWIANTLFFIIFIVFAFSFFGFYEITLPSSWTTKTDKMADKGGLIGIFFMAFTLALVSFSCTGPIVGTALVQAATKGEFVGPFLVMFGFSLALALPFGLFAAFPSWLNSLPKSGSWMNSVKVVLGFLELALAFKFLSVADMTNHWGFLKYELFMGIWIVIFALMAAYLFGLFKFPHDSVMRKLTAVRMSFGILAVVIVGYLMTGFIVKEETNSYNALSLMSGLAPPTGYNWFLEPSDLDPAISAKYKSYGKCANNIDCFKDYYEGLAYARETGKPLFIDFTGYGCVNCRKTEEHIWVDDKVRKILNEDVVLVSLYGDDDTPTSEELQSLKSVYTDQRMRNIGKIWADFQLANFETNAQPLYVFVSQDQEVLTNPRPFKEGVADYLEFLECGLNTNKLSLSKK
jgi:thiol:disulfide interchange protein DsbD